ncbi:MAG: mannose-1-phosphate guanyltransferase [Bacillota bacterium]|uniref:sugar phosphate nucleotidyltransferase n=1 Tax=Desulforudis sp. DRI-14 TaxID=3459793 RepID=UPI00347A9693
MKAIIMAGGEGSRLRPLTCGKPKPMVPLLNRPVMVYCIELLKQCGITDIGVTLMYLPDAIRDHFDDGSEYGVNLHYFVEETPLGTAGSVKNAGSFLDETFVVISGDALTDLNLAQAIQFHKERGAIATLVLTRVPTPLEYGVVIADAEGHIVRFLEKPSWGEVFSDTVNTGIYVLEPEALGYFAPGQPFDFSKDLFPLLLGEKKPLFGVVLDGYWCDIGNLEAYMQAHRDALSGRVTIKIPGEEIAPQVWAGHGVHLDPECVLKGPSFIGDNCVVGPGAVIDSYTVLGSGCIVQGGASVKRSICWDNVYIGPRAHVRGAVLCSRVQVQTTAGVYEGAVVGDDSIIKEGGTLMPEVKLWPRKLVDVGATVNESIVWGTRKAKAVFGTEGVSGLTNIEMTPEFCARLAAAFGSAFRCDAKVGVSWDGYPATAMLKRAAVAGLQSAGVAVLDLGQLTTPAHRFGVRNLDCSGGVHIKLSTQDSSRVILTLTDGRGGNISRALERKIENLMAREDFRRADATRLQQAAHVPGMLDAYLQAVLDDVDAGAVADLGGHLLMLYDGLLLSSLVGSWSRELDLHVSRVGDETSGRQPRPWRAMREAVENLTRKVVEDQATAGAVLDANGEHLILIDDKGRVIEDDMLTALIALYVLKSNRGSVVVPVTAPHAIEKMAERYKGSVVRTKTSPQDFVEKILAQDVSQFFLHFDGLSALTRILGFMGQTGSSLSELVDEIPVFYLDKKDVPVSWDAKGRVIRRLIETEDSSRMELLDGVKVFHRDGWSLVLPDPEQPLCKVFSEGVSMEVAESLTEMYIGKINQIIKNANK